LSEERRAGPTPRTTVGRLPERARYDRDAIHAILDEGLVCHVGFVADGQPFVIAATYARWDDRLVIHGSAASRMMKALAGGAPVCASVTLLDGLVLARSAFHHSMNYRSVVVVGTAAEIVDPLEKLRALEAIVEHVAPGRGASVRPPSEIELRATRVVTLPLDEASAKVRTGPPKDDEEDYALPVWAGEIPLALQPGPAAADPLLAPGIALPPEVLGWRRPRR
jgi:nitroimidazol reductase NimA-like FMN-containing flavoprotein (pyridoxamine 5'-phosphate oxidase superfamily)